MASDEMASGPLGVDDLYSLEEYHRIRADFRSRVMAHKKPRRVALGTDAMLYFEDRLTVQYQIQEMLRIERLFEREAIEEELAAYNPLIPDGHNLKATFMIEIPDPDERRIKLAGLSGIEDCLAAVVSQTEKVVCIADEDLERSEPDKTSAVHFVRFEFSENQVQALKGGATLGFEVDHPNYSQSVVLDAQSRNALVADLA